MRLSLLLGMALSTVGCFSIQPAVHPWLTPQDAVALPAIEGTWVEEGDDPMTLKIARLADGADSEDGADGPTYELTVLKNDRPVKGSLDLTLGRLDGTLYWDLTPLCLEETADLWDAHMLGLHSLARLTVEGDRLEVAFLDPSWVGESLTDGRLSADHLLLDDAPLLTGATADLQRLVIEHADEDGAFAKPTIFGRCQVLH